MLVPIDGKMLKDLRESKDIPQQFLADLLKCKRQTISNIENGITKTTDEKNVYELAKFFDISRMELQGFKNTPEEQSLAADKKVLDEFLNRVYLGEMRETDQDILFAIARLFRIHLDEAKKILTEQNCSVTVYDKKKTVLESPIKYGCYRDRVICKINFISESKLPALGRILDYIENSNIEKLQQLEDICKITCDDLPLNTSYNDIKEYIYYRITEYDTPLFWKAARTQISQYSFDISSNEKNGIRQTIASDLGSLRHNTTNQLDKLLKKWKTQNK